MGEITKATVALDGSAKGVAEQQHRGVAQEQPGEKKPGEAAEQKVEGGQQQQEGGEQKVEGEGTEASHPSALNEKPEGEQGLLKPGEKTEEQKAAEAATGLDLTPFSDEYAEKGALSEESYAKLAEKGITRATADTYVAGLKAQVSERLNTLATAVGGVDNYNGLIKWAAGTLSDAEKKEAVKVLSSGSIEGAQTYLQGLNAKFVKANGKVPGKSSSGGGSPAPDVFANRQEQAAAMRDPKYRTDAKYRKEVEAKSLRSFGTKTRSRTKKKSSPIRQRAQKGRR